VSTRVEARLTEHHYSNADVTAKYLQIKIIRQLITNFTKGSGGRLQFHYLP